MLTALVAGSCSSKKQNRHLDDDLPPPNILWITCEDIGPHLGCYGFDYADTPVLDELAARGTVYLNAWSNAPVCAPARTTIITGVIVTVVSFLLYLLGASGWVVVSAVLVFSVGEMLASPKSKEYAGRIAPPDKVGMYMGYFYWCVALGNLFGGLLSGVSYQYFGPKGIDRPDIMWIIFAAFARVTAVLLAIYNRAVRRTV